MLEVMLGQAAVLDFNAHARKAMARQRLGFDDFEKLCHLIYNYLGDASKKSSSMGTDTQPTAVSLCVLVWFIW